jgi:uncharacterized protein (TIGR02757 family)
MNIRILNSYYERYNRREYVHPDPLEFLYNYSDTVDREIAGIVASSLAYGRVAQILNSVNKVLEVMGESPSLFLKNSSIDEITDCFKGFKHRFARDKDLVGLLLAIKSIMAKHDTLNEAFLCGYSPSDENILPALASFTEMISSAANGTNLISAPSKGSACKRLNLFLRWMVRSDDVDPGGWRGISPSKLIVPLDTHMYRISSRLGFTKRKQANLKTAIEITKAFAAIDPEDPVRFDFALTRLGIRTDTNMEEFFNRINSTNKN